MAPPTPYTPITEFPDLSAQLIPQKHDVLQRRVTFANEVEIDSIANTTPIQITTLTAHDFITGDKVDVIGSAISAANVSANPVTVISSTVFSLDGTTAGGSSGTNQGKVRATYLGTLARLIDAAYYLGQRVVPQTLSVYNFNGGFGVSAVTVTSATFVDASPVQIDVTGAANNDILVIDFSCQVLVSLVSAHTAQVQLVVTEDFGGTPSTSTVLGSRRKVISTSPVSTRISISCTLTVSDPGTARVKLQACVPETTGADSISVDGFATLRVLKIHP